MLLLLRAHGESAPDTAVRIETDVTVTVRVAAVAWVCVRQQMDAVLQMEVE